MPMLIVLIVLILKSSGLGILPLSVTTIITNQCRQIDSHRTILPLLLFYLGLDLTFTFGVFLSALWPFGTALLLTPALSHENPLLYNGIIFWTKIASFGTPFIFTFLLLPKGLRMMGFLQKLETNLVMKIVNKIFLRHYKKHKTDPRMPKPLGKITKHLMHLNLWFQKRKTWEQYGIVLSLFVLNNPYVVYGFLM